MADGKCYDRHRQCSIVACCCIIYFRAGPSTGIKYWDVTMGHRVDQGHPVTCGSACKPASGAEIQKSPTQGAVPLMLSVLRSKSRIDPAGEAVFRSEEKTKLS
ncbi:hypothetical protein HaLaN_27312, partial [Haematococcus lacustris]